MTKLNASTAARAVSIRRPAAAVSGAAVAAVAPRLAAAVTPDPPLPVRRRMSPHANRRHPTSKPEDTAADQFGTAA
ncbi:hypothetical protein GCM10009099_30840 [Caenispirillum bisanense]